MVERRLAFPGPVVAKEALGATWAMRVQYHPLLTLAAAEGVVDCTQPPCVLP
jgi:hypothetical protein